ncbi:MAG: nitroreductase family protein [Fidelibacterota bacterium]|nr:MAG: nitroreductase family protein [Candidatus Neomarinimicrobiota bacterium]
MTTPDADTSLNQPQQPVLVPLRYTPVEPQECLARARRAYEQLEQRRSVRHFSDRPVPREVIEYLIRTATTAPSGAHKQPWTFVAVSDPALKTEIRQAAEAEERKNYEQRLTPEWLDALQPLGVDWHKPFLEIAPWLVVVFKQTVELLGSGERRKNYYVSESVGIAVGLFLAAMHQAGLVALTYTPSPMKFLSEILKRPPNDKPVMIIPVGYPAGDCRVPDLQRKRLEEVAVFLEG